MTDRKAPAGKPPAKELLDDLLSVKSLLNEPHGDQADWHNDVPTLGTDSSQQIPLLTPDAAPTDASASLRQAIANRDNPFLSKAAAALPPRADALPPTAGKGLDPAQVKNVVDALIEEWLPRIERELRARLSKRLTRPGSQS